MAYKGFFKPRNPEKYAGNPSNIIYRSRWEWKYMDLLDRHPEVLKWASEELAIPYWSPVDRRKHRYYPDFLVQKRGVNGVQETIMVEIKPKSQVLPPKPAKTKSGKPARRYLKEQATWHINQAKWEAARKYCDDRNWKFEIVTEIELGIKY